MRDYVHPAAFAATAIVSLALGFGAATWITSGKTENGPIINPTAWEETAPAPQVQTVSLTNSAKPSTIAPTSGAPTSVAKCSPWEITDVAMEEVLNEMISRGWRPPNQGEAVMALGVPGIAATDPTAPMPYRSNWQPLDPNVEAVSDAAAVPAPNDPAGGAPQPAAIAQPPAQSPAPPPADS